jgi:Fe-S-cluster containining protein
VKKEMIFLTVAQALEAICDDLRRYDPQILLFCEMIRVISNGSVFTKRQDHQNGAWVRIPGEQTMRLMDGPMLAEYLCNTLKAMDLNAAILSSLCTRVFQTRCVPGVDANTGGEGVRIETGMEQFHCRRCGQCCRSLDYHDALTAEDVTRWQLLGRTDILKWVGVFHRKGQNPVYRIWMIPGTRTFSEQCPFLKQDSDTGHWSCRIQDVKPKICRQYPMSRKHALMTGCPGFEAIQGVPASSSPIQNLS